MAPSDLQRLSVEAGDATRRLAMNDEDRKLCRTAESRQVLANFGRVFHKEEFQYAGVMDAAHSGGGTRQTLIPLPGGEHEEADAMYASTKQCFHHRPHAFLSHVWSAARWQKFLALCFYLNSPYAVAAAVLAWACACAYAVLVWGGGDIYGLGGLNLVPLIVYLPVGVFFVFALTAHTLLPPINQEWWLDKLCIHQSRPDVKAAGIGVLPKFVAASGRMIVVWDEEYLSRLWCNAEVAAFTASHGGADEIDFLPLWLVPWIFSTILVDLFSATVACSLYWIIPAIGNMVAETSLPPSLQVLAVQTAGIGTAMAIAYLPASVPNYVSLRRKMHLQRLMLEQLSTYCIQKARCSVESDRTVVEDIVMGLFGEKDSRAEGLEHFNSFVREDLKEVLVARLGDSTFIPYRTSCMVFMPLIFSAAADVLSCDLQRCSRAYKAEGYATLPTFMVSNSCVWIGGVLGIVPTSLPLMASLISWLMRTVQTSWLQQVLCLLAVILSYCYMTYAWGLFAGLIENAVTLGGVWGPVLIGFCGLYCWLNWRLFLRAAPALAGAGVAGPPGEAGLSEARQLRRLMTL